MFNCPSRAYILKKSTLHKLIRGPLFCLGKDDSKDWCYMLILSVSEGLKNNLRDNLRFRDFSMGAWESSVVGKALSWLAEDLCSSLDSYSPAAGT